MFWKKKQSNGDDEEGESARKKPGRKIFGFQCSPDIHANAKVLAKQLNVDLYVVCEHAMQLGLIEIAASMKDSEEREMLLKHLSEEHTIKWLIESVSTYDAQAAVYIRAGQARRHHMDQAIRDLVELWCRYNLDPRLMREIILGELQRMTELMRNRQRQK
jgi:hypothetical protein